MKRSIIENKIASVLNTMDTVTTSNRVKAIAVLEAALALGMLPPLTEKLIRDSDDTGYYEFVDKVYDWDNE